MTYGQLLNQIEHIGEALGASGIMATDRVALVASNGPDMIAAFLGIAAVAACAKLIFLKNFIGKFNLGNLRQILMYFNI